MIVNQKINGVNKARKIVILVTELGALKNTRFKRRQFVFIQSVAVRVISNSSGAIKPVKFPVSGANKALKIVNIAKEVGAMEK